MPTTTGGMPPITKFANQLNPGCNCCGDVTHNWIFAFTSCGTPIPAGVTCTFVQGGVTVFVGATNSLGIVGPVPLAAGSFSVSLDSCFGYPRFVTPLVSSVGSSGGSAGLALQPSSGYICTGTCTFPLSRSMLVSNGTTSATFTWNTGSSAYQGSLAPVFSIFQGPGNTFSLFATPATTNNCVLCGPSSWTWVFGLTTYTMTEIYP